MFEIVRAKLPGPPEFLLCVLPEKKNSEIYGMSVYCFLDLLSLQSSNKFYIVKDLGRREVLVILELSHNAFPLLKSMTSTSQMYFLKSIPRYMWGLKVTKFSHVFLSCLCPAIADSYYLFLI